MRVTNVVFNISNKVLEIQFDLCNETFSIRILIYQNLLTFMTVLTVSLPRFKLLNRQTSFTYLIIFYRQGTKYCCVINLKINSLFESKICDTD